MTTNDEVTARQAVADADVAAVREQLGRPPRGMLAVAARAVDGAPLVVTTAPLLPDGTPFPTVYYLTHPVVVAAMSRLEADGRMREYEAAVVHDQAVASAYLAAHEAYLAQRAAIAEVPQLAGISAGGMPVRVKCLHALAAHALAAGAGVNPIGDRALAEAAASDAALAGTLGLLSPWVRSV